MVLWAGVNPLGHCHCWHWGEGSGWRLAGLYSSCVALEIRRIDVLFIGSGVHRCGAAYCE